MYDIETIRKNAKKEGLKIKEMYGLNGEEDIKLIAKLGKIDMLTTHTEKALTLLEDYIGIKNVTAEQLLAFHFLIDLIEEGKFNI